MSHVRTWVKLSSIVLIAVLLIGGLTLYAYKPTYSVTLNGELIGYTQDKTSLQNRINSVIQSSNEENVAFVQIDNMPKYDLCLLKKDIETNDDEIYDIITKQGVKYYNYYALLNDGEEKYYFGKLEDAEEVVQKLKDNESSNIKKITVEEKYETELPDFSDIDTAYKGLYKKKIMYTATGSASSVWASGINNSDVVVPIGISLVRPVTNYQLISSRFGYRSRDNHKGLDIAAASGTPIYAAAGGTVVFSGWNSGGYGNMVLINHGNGISTLYAHCSSVSVTAGDTVSQGQYIAAVGTTGLSTGNHLHFEVRVNGVAQNPQNYVY